MKTNRTTFVSCLFGVVFGTAFLDPTWALSQPSVQSQSRRAFVASSVFFPQVAAQAFDGSGSSSYSGRTPLEKTQKVKGYKDRIVADVKDFKRLGTAIDQGDVNMDGDAWVGFFIKYQRREADAVGRTYAAQLDLIGVEKSGGAALLLATTFAKPNKPPTNLPQYKKYDALLKIFDPIQKAGKAGDAAKAKQEWATAAAALTEYLAAVEMPADLSDPLYK